MQVGSVRGLVVSSVAVCALVALGASSAAATPTPSWGNGVEAVLPANDLVNGGAFIESISCPSAGNCSAVGSYDDSSGLGQGVLLTETGGQWADGVQTVLPANAVTTYSPGTPGAYLRFVSCASAGNCTAIGTYDDSSGNQQGVLLTETDGSWSAGVEAVLPPDAATSQFVQWGGLSCASAGNCAAVGLYSPVGHPFGGGLMLTETNGSWSAGVAAVSPAPDSNAELNSVSCGSAGNCVAVGTYDDSSNVAQALVLTETAGNWAPGVEAALPVDSTNQGAELDSVSCASAGNCTAVGLYDASSVAVGSESEWSGKGLLLTETGGSWATGVEAALPADADGPNAVNRLYPPTVSCSSPGNCSVAGSYYDNNLGVQGVLLTETGGSWTTGVEAMPTNVANAGSAGFLNSISCASPGNCGALVAGEHLLTETADSWSTGVDPPLPANGVGGLLYSVSCDPAGDCSAVGEYTDTSGNGPGLLIGGLPAKVKVDISEAGTGIGTVSSAPSGIDCGATCSASFDAGTSLTLTATASPGSGFIGWSGGGCTGTGTCQVNTGISEQAITARFSLPVKVVVSKDGNGSGVVSSVPAGIHCGSTCSASFTAGSSLTLIATPSRGSRFTGWSSDGCSGTRRNCELTDVSAEQAVLATFKLLPKCVVPKLKGKPVKAAEHAIRTHNCTVGKITYATSRTIEKKHVIFQKPKAGRRLSHGTRVNLIVSKGRR